MNNDKNKYLYWILKVYYKDKQKKVLMEKRILIIDAGLGNVGSVRIAFERLGCETHVSKEPKSIQEKDYYSHLVLPGVGSFKEGMYSLKQRNWISWIQEDWFKSNKPFLGICLGMQLLASRGDEGSYANSKEPGLDIIKGEVVKIKSNEKLPLPHVGWNSVKRIKNSPLDLDINENSDFYFVHSYEFLPEDESSKLSYVNYGKDIIVGVNVGKYYGVQFHPEKSQRVGMRLLRNFTNI